MRRQKDLLCYKPKQGKKGLQTCEEGVVHPSESHGLGDEVFVNAVLAALAAETALLDTAESVAYLAFCFLYTAYLSQGDTYGEAGSEMIPVLTPTIPTSSASATRKMRLMLLL